MISVVIPTHNRRETLNKALQSVFEQTCREYEVIVVDDGSTDGTAGVLAEINNPKLRYVRFETNRGGCSARNRGIEESRGDIVAFLDDDDWWMPEKLEKQRTVLKEEGIDLCYTARHIVSPGKKTRRYSSIKPRYRDTYRAIMYDNFIGSTSSVMVKKTVLEEVGGFDPALPALQDYDLYIRIAEKGYTVKEIEEPLLIYRVVDENKSISCSYRDFATAAHYLLKKHGAGVYAGYLKRSIRRITMKKALKSRQFMMRMIRARFGKTTITSC